MMYTGDVWVTRVHASFAKRKIANRQWGKTCVLGCRGGLGKLILKRKEKIQGERKQQMK